jgi:hypothetical protein
MGVLSKTLLILGLVGLVVGFVLYLQGTVLVEVSSPPVVIDKYTLSIQQGFFSDAHYCKIQVTPTSEAEPDTNYLLVMDNGMVRQSYKVSWSQLELDIHKPKTLTNKISQDEYTALGMQSAHLTAFEMSPERRMLWLVPGIVLLGMFVLSYVLSRRKISETGRGDGRPIVEPRPSPVGARPDVTPDGTIWYGWPNHRPPSRTPPPTPGVQGAFAGAEPQGEPIDLGSPFGDILTNERINRLCREGKIDIREAESLRRQISGMDILQRNAFLRSVEYRDEDEEL